MPHFTKQLMTCLQQIIHKSENLSKVAKEAATLLSAQMCCTEKEVLHRGYYPLLGEVTGG